MFQLDLKSRKSIYEQVVDNVKELIMTGILPEEAKLPSVRELSKNLTVNPNTVQKAYRELERQGYIYTVTGLGSFVAAREENRPDRTKVLQLKEELRRQVQELMYLGIPAEEIRKAMEEILKEGGMQK